MLHAKLDVNSIYHLLVYGLSHPSVVYKCDEKSLRLRGRYSLFKIIFSGVIIVLANQLIDA